MGLIGSPVQSGFNMEAIEISNEQEFDQLKELQRKFTRSMAEFEAEFSTAHMNGCRKRLGKCKICLFKQKLIILEDEFKQMVGKMVVKLD